MSGYHVDLYYGYEEGEYGVSLEFLAVDPKVGVGNDKIADRLAESLDVSPDDYHFNYNSCSLELPASLVERIQEDAIKDYVAKQALLHNPGARDLGPGDREGFLLPQDNLNGGEAAGAKNTKIVYRYTDASNYHARNEAVLSGIFSEEQKQMILDCLDPEGFFVPGAVGLDVELPWEFDPEDDHPFWALDEDSFEETTRMPTVSVTVEQLVAAFVENQDKWEQLGVEYAAQFESDYEADDVGEIIQEASERSYSSFNASTDDKDIALK